MSVLRRKTVSVVWNLLFILILSFGNKVLVVNGDDRYGFIVSHIVKDPSWCIFVPDNASDYDNLGFRPCDFAWAPQNQLWRVEADGKIRSSANPDKCMIVNFGHDIFDGVRVRVANCDLDSNLIHFNHNGNKSMISLEADRDYCVTNRGVNPHDSDTIHAKPCKDDGRFFFTFRAEDLPSTSSPTMVPLTSTPATFEPVIAPGSPPYYRISTDEACLSVRNSNPYDDQRFILKNCGGVGQGFREDGNHFRIQLNDEKCMQAGRPTVSPRHGTKMRIYKCDESEFRQKFELEDGKMRLQGRDLCVDHRGVNANVNEDPVILKDCSKAGHVHLELM